MIGCGTGDKDSSQSTPSIKKKDETPQAETIETTEGFTTYHGSNGEKLWKVFWNKGEFTGSASGSKIASTADMTGVHGEIYKAEKTASTFKADHGAANDETKILTLTDRVQIDSKDPAFTLTCDRVDYDGKLKIIKAHGHVRVLGTISTVGTLDDLWATPDFTKIASPKLFDQR